MNIFHFGFSFFGEQGKIMKCSGVGGYNKNRTTQL